MKGIDVKTELRRNGFTLTQVASLLGESQQNLNAALSKDDIKTGLIERISVATGIPIATFYGDPITALASGDNAQAVAGNNNNVNTQQAEFLKELSAQRKLTEKSQEQIDRLLGVIEKLSENKKV